MVRCLGALVGVFYAASGATQFAAGFVVDRVGARPVLFAGLALLATATLARGLAPGFGWLFPVVAAEGIGNGVFHPADFAILNANVARQRLGHAYATHGIGGNLGYVARAARQLRHRCRVRLARRAAGDGRRRARRRSA